MSAYRPNDDRCSLHTPPKATYADLLPRWMSEGNCAGMDTELFDVDLPSDGRMTRPVLRAKAICHGCPVADRCIDYAFSLESYADLVWGGLTGRERMAIRGRRDRVKRAAAIRLQQGIVYRFGGDEEKGEVA